MLGTQLIASILVLSISLEPMNRKPSAEEVQRREGKRERVEPRRAKADPTPPGEPSRRKKRPRLEVSYVGPAREISHSSSASRDTFAMSMTILPRPVLTAGGEFSILGFRFSGMTWRVGFHGMLELESHEKTKRFAGRPEGDISYWRGIFGYSLALSLDRLARRWLGKGSALEATLTGRHESEHYTGSNDGGEGTDYSDRPHIGDFIMLDLAVRYRIRRVDLIARLQHKFFLPGRSGYSHGPGGDLVVRWRLNRWVHPFGSFFGEHLSGTDHFNGTKFPDAYLVRGLAGAILPSRFGEMYIYLSADVGHRKGLAVYTEEATLGLGIRVAFY